MSEIYENGFQQAFSESARAKINLYLHVTGKRADGYHLLDSLAVFAGAGDELHYYPGAEALHLEFSGRFGALLKQDAAGSDNLVMKAASLIQSAVTSESCVQGGRLVLRKELPVASGIGGGSADAAAALRLLNRVWKTNLTDAVLKHLAEKLGADVPVCLEGKAARMEGTGEVLSSAPVLPSCGMILVNCGAAVSTPEIFRRREGVFLPAVSLPPGWHDARSLAEFLALQTNSLQSAACAVCPTIKEVLTMLSALPECLLVRMSGSGATCFALFPTEEIARKNVSMISDKKPEWWVWGGGFS